MRKILLVEEDVLIREKFSNLLREERYYVIAVKDRNLALNCLEREGIDIMIVDESLLQENSFELLSISRQRLPNPKGIYEYLPRPLTPSRISSAVKRAVERIVLWEENKDLKRRIDFRFSFAGITGVSEKMQRLFSLILQVSQVKRPVLLVGEQGTGKEMVARAIHQYAFPEEKPFFKILCSNLTLGTLKGGTFYRKDESGNVTMPSEGLKTGTVYFEDIHLLPYPLQAELVDFLEENRFGRGEKDIHIVASSEVPLEEEVNRGTFRNDLFYFLNAVKIEVPSLRDRKEDIAFLTDVFLKQICEETGRKTIKISKEALKLLVEYNWPGNITELRNTLEGMAILSEGEVITPEDIPSNIKSGIAHGDPIHITVGMSLEETEKVLIRETLKANRYNKSKTARILGIGLRTLYRKIEQYDLAKEMIILRPHHWA
ncbi:MAG: sigma-54 dependent transcriptional regulator [Candidatus Atribacteria bacterium]|nr:sigma-54 dependent transcriptional regulator [Candidatus Atribacteria bacterium]